jgi:hypothetical protein
MLVISCHSDTGFRQHAMRRLEHGMLEGHMDNFVGVHAVMLAYFSGRLHQPYIRIELTYGEETDMAGAYEVLDTLYKQDVVLVVDVTGTPTEADFVIEKCRNQEMQRFLWDALSGLAFDMYDDCPDPIADSDETDVYDEKCPYVCFLGIPCLGGDYNEGPVRCRQKSIEQIAEALCRIAEAFPRF